MLLTLGGLGGVFAGCAGRAGASVDADRTAPASPAIAAPKAPVATAFPADWLGNWRGRARVTPAAGAPIEFTMGLDIATTATPGTFTWTIIYAGEAGTQTRPYTIESVAAKPNAFVIDEQNSILIDAIHLDGALYSSFEIQGTTINVVYRLNTSAPEGDEIVVELVSTVEANARESGGKEGVPPVTSRAPVSLQRAVLKRVDAQSPQSPQSKR